jgi:hypothetical protein
MYVRENWQTKLFVENLQTTNALVEDILRESIGFSCVCRGGINNTTEQKGGQLSTVQYI